MSKHRKQHKSSQAATILEGVGHELKVNPPKILAHTREKFGAKRAEEQRKAILLDKARRRGARIRKRR